MTIFHKITNSAKLVILPIIPTYAKVSGMAVFYKIVKWVKNGVLMIIHIYAKVSTSKFKLLLVQGSLD
jgi:hypothetical protein